jgi:prephenate dehydrogenase
VPPTHDDIQLLDRIKSLLAPMQLKRVVFTSAQDHDSMIAFTSQLAHVVSNAYIKSPSAQQHKGYSAGSFRDLTRVAWLNENMWTELFLENKDNLLREIHTLINNLTQYASAMEADDAATLCALLRDGRIAKELSDK